MEKMNALTLIITLVVGVILTGALLGPVISDATKTTETYTNDGYFRMAHYDATSDHTMFWTYEKPDTVTVDNVDVKLTYPTTAGSSVTVIADTDWIFRLYVGPSGPAFIDYIPSTGGVTRATVADSMTLTVTLTSGSMSASFSDGTTKTGTYSDIWLPSNNGDLTMKKADKTAYVLGDSEIVGYGISSPLNHNGQPISGPGDGIYLTGTYDDGITGTIWRGTNGALSDIETHATADDAHKDLYLFDKITATFTLTETVEGETVTTDTALTYNYVIVPYQVTAELSNHLTPGQISLMGAIPVMVIVALLMVAVGAIALRRND